MNQTTQLVFDCSTRLQEGYALASLNVWLKDFPYESSHEPFRKDYPNTLCLSWQGHRRGEDSDWYAFRIGEQGFDNTQNMTHVLQLARRVLSGKFSRIQPADVVARLRKLKAVYTVLDRRMHRQLLPEQVAPEGYHYYCADVQYQSSYWGHTMASVEEAPKAVMSTLYDRLVSQASNSSSFYNLPAEFVEEWAKAGQPVRCLSRNEEYPDMRAPLDILTVPAQAHGNRW